MQLSVAGQVSNTATVSISSAANCTTLAGDFSASPNSNYGQVNLVRGSLSFNGFPQTYNTIGPAFLKFGPVASAPFIAPPAGGGCIVDFFQNSSGNSTFPNFAGAVTGILDAGTITYTAPNVGSFALTNGPNGYAQATLSSVPAGAHTITSNGGKDIGAMNLTYNVPAQFNGKTDVTGSTIRRANGFTGSWNSCPDNAGTVIVGAFSLDTANAVQGTVYCSVSCSAGSFKIGSDLLGQLPLGTSGGAGAFTAFIGVPGKITATGLDAAYFTFLDFISLESLTMVP